MKLVPDWKKAWRWHSNRAMGAIAAMPLVWVSLPADLKKTVPPEWLPWIAAVVAVAGIVGRLMDQDK